MDKASLTFTYVPGGPAPDAQAVAVTTGVRDSDFGDARRRTVTTQLQGDLVLFDGALAPIIYTSAGQVSAIVLYGASDKAGARVEVEYAGVRSDAVIVIEHGKAGDDHRAATTPQRSRPQRDHARKQTRRARVRLSRRRLVNHLAFWVLHVLGLRSSLGCGERRPIMRE